MENLLSLSYRLLFIYLCFQCIYTCNKHIFHWIKSNRSWMLLLLFYYHIVSLLIYLLARIYGWDASWKSFHLCGLRTYEFNSGHFYWLFFLYFSSSLEDIISLSLLRSEQAVNLVGKVATYLTRLTVTFSLCIVINLKR